MIEYVLNSLGWSVLGFALGWLFASLRQDVAAIKESVMPDQTPHPDQGPPAPDQGHPHRISTDRATRWLGIFIALLAIVTVTQGVLAQRRIGEVAECQADFNADFAEAMKLRVELANQDRLALQTMLVEIYRQREAPENRRAETFQEWVETTEATEAERRRNPLPELPEGDCR